MGKRYSIAIDVKKLKGVIASWLQSNFYDGPANAFAALLAHVVTFCTGMPCTCFARDDGYIPDGHNIQYGEYGSPGVVYVGEIAHPNLGALMFYLDGDACADAWLPLLHAGGTNDEAIAKRIAPRVAKMLSSIELEPKISLDFDNHHQLGDLIPFVDPSKIIAYAIALDGETCKDLDAWTYEHYCQYRGLLESPKASPEYIASGFLNGVYLLSDIQYPFSKRVLDTDFIEGSRFSLVANALVPNFEIDVLGVEWLIAGIVCELGWAKAWTPDDGRVIVVPPEIYQNVHDTVCNLPRIRHEVLYKGFNERTHFDAIVADLEDDAHIRIF